MNARKWSIRLMTLALATILFIAAATVIIDPFFHYHKPLDGLSYPLFIERQRYQNDGIVRHFDYDAIITGTSMTENFKASQWDSLLGANTIKVPFYGATFQELNRNLRRAIDANPNIKTIVCSIDDGRLYQPRDFTRYECPLYMYDDDLLNDVQYLLNKAILCNDTIRVLQHTHSGAQSTSFDDYSFWGGSSGTGGFTKEYVLQNYSRVPLSEEEQPLTAELRQQVIENLEENTIKIAQENPNIQFYYFFPPYSILYWDQADRLGTMERELSTYLLASEMLVEVENIHLFSFFTDYETITNLDNYCDRLHYSADINALVLQYMSQDEYRLTRDNYQAHWQAVADFYQAYDYDAIFEE